MQNKSASSHFIAISLTKTEKADDTSVSTCVLGPEKYDTSHSAGVKGLGRPFWTTAGTILTHTFMVGNGWLYVGDARA